MKRSAVDREGAPAKAARVLGPPKNARNRTLPPTHCTAELEAMMGIPHFVLANCPTTPKVAFRSLEAAGGAPVLLDRKTGDLWAIVHNGIHANSFDVQPWVPNSQVTELCDEAKLAASTLAPPHLRLLRALNAEGAIATHLTTTYGADEIYARVQARAGARKSTYEKVEHSVERFISDELLVPGRSGTGAVRAWWNAEAFDDLIGDPDRRWRLKQVLCHLEACDIGFTHWVEREADDSDMLRYGTEVYLLYKRSVLDGMSFGSLAQF